MFHVYVLRCRDGSLYTGYTNDLKKRLALHEAGKGSKYTCSRLPVEIIAQWTFKTKSEAMRKELAFKSLPRKTKLEEIRND